MARAGTLASAPDSPSSTSPASARTCALSKSNSTLSLRVTTKPHGAPEGRNLSSSGKRPAGGSGGNGAMRTSRATAPTVPVPSPRFSAMPSGPPIQRPEPSARTSMLPSSPTQSPEPSPWFSMLPKSPTQVPPPLPSSAIWPNSPT